MIGQIAQCEFTAKKSLLCCEMNNAEQKQYEELYLEIEKGIISAQSDIEATKKELHRAKQVRKNKMEYDALAAIIQSQPDRQTNQDKLASMSCVAYPYLSSLLMKRFCFWTSAYHV